MKYVYTVYVRREICRACGPDAFKVQIENHLANLPSPFRPVLINSGLRGAEYVGLRGIRGSVDGALASVRRESEKKGRKREGILEDSGGKYSVASSTSESSSFLAPSGRTCGFYSRFYFSRKLHVSSRVNFPSRLLRVNTTTRIYTGYRANFKEKGKKNDKNRYAVGDPFCFIQISRSTVEIRAFKVLRARRLRRLRMDSRSTDLYFFLLKLRTLPVACPQ